MSCQISYLGSTNVPRKPKRQLVNYFIQVFMYMSYSYNLLPLPNLHTVLVAHNGFVFDFRILAAEVERRNLIVQFNRADLGFADTLYELRKVC